MKDRRDWPGLIFWSAVLLVIVAAIVISAQLSPKSAHFHDNPTNGDVNNGALVIGTGFVPVVMFYGWVEWNRRHPRSTGTAITTTPTTTPRMTRTSPLGDAPFTR